MLDSLLEKLPRYFLYALFLLLSVFFVPTLSLPFDLQKQMLLAAAVFGAGVLWVIDVLRKREITFRWHALYIPLGLFVLFALISMLGSGAISHSFWGANAETDSFFNILLFALLFVLVANKLAKREYAAKAVGFFVAGAVLAALFLFASSLFSSTFAFGSPYAFAVYAGGAFLVALALKYAGVGALRQTLNAAETKTSAFFRRIVQRFSAASAVILFLALLFVSQWVAWAGVAAGSLLVLYFVARHPQQSAVSLGEPEGSSGPRTAASIRVKMLVPLAVFGLSLLFWFIGNPLDDVLKLSPEVRLGRQMTTDIAKSTVSSSARNALFGSGPATFANQYRLHRSPSINSTPFWNTTFDRGAGTVTHFFAATGVLGGGAIAILWLWFLWFCARFTLKRAPNFSVILGGIYFLIAWLLFATNLMLLFAGFLFLALWVALRGRQKRITFSASSALMFWGMAGSVAVLVAFVFGGYSVWRVYSAELSYARGVANIDAKNYEGAIDELQKAARIIEFDKYFRKLSQAIFLQTSSIYRDQGLALEERDALVQRGITAAEGAAVLATQVNSTNSINFEQVGDFYTNIIPISDSAATMPFSYYNRAAELNPQSPFIPLKKARAHLANAKRFAAKGTDKSRQAYSAAVVEARKEAENSLKLKEDFEDALEFLAGLPQ